MHEWYIYYAKSYQERKYSGKEIKMKRFYNVLLSCIFLLFLENFAIADSRVQQKWLDFLEKRSCANVSKAECQKNKAFIQEYLAVVPNKCVDNESESVCFYKLKKPLRLQGLATIKRDYQAGACDKLESISFEAQDSNVASLLKNFYIEIMPSEANYKAVAPYIENWFQNNLAGEIALFVSFEANSFFIADYSACGNGNTMQANNVKVQKVNMTNIYGRENYENTAEYGNLNISLTGSDSVNLYDKPNGKVIARINPKGADSYLVWNLGWDSEEEFSWAWRDSAAMRFGILSWQQLIGYPLRQDSKPHTSKNNKEWQKVLYFPPNITNANKAKVGYIQAQ